VKIIQQAAMVLVLLVIVACSWLKPMDSPAMAQADAGLKRALVSFASARAIGGVLSVVQAAQLDIKPAGVGVTLAPGQLLAPVNDLVKHFADLMLLASVAFGIQKFLISIGGHFLISTVLTVTTVIWLYLKLRENYVPMWLSRSLVIILMLRFAIPVALIGTGELSQKFLNADYDVAQSGIKATADAVGVGGPAVSPASQAPGWFSPITIPKMPDYRKLKERLEESAGHVVKLMVVFLLQTLLMPLVMIWSMYGVAKGAMERQRHPRSHDR
jgi:hypothetical protein